MTSWIVTIDKKHPGHWAIAKQHGFWDLTKHRDIAKGDIVYFWQAGKSFLAQTRATSDAAPLQPGATASWEDSGTRKYASRFEFDVLDEAPREQPQWVKEIGPRLAGKTPDLRSIPRFDDPSDEALFAQFFREAHTPRDPQQTLDDTRRERVLDNLDEDLRVRRLQLVALRQGQPQFRGDLLRAYSGRCAITGTAIESVLEAAHISPHKGGHTNEVWNGLLLRADIHTLFDLFLITVDASTMRVRVSSALTGSEYESLVGVPLNLPSRLDEQPLAEALTSHNESCDWLCP